MGWLALLVKKAQSISFFDWLDERIRPLFAPRGERIQREDR